MAIYLNGKQVGDNHYPNGEVMFDDIEKNVIENNSKAHIFAQYNNPKDFETLMMLGAYINYLGMAKSKILDLWYVPYLRMDRQVGTKDPVKYAMLKLLDSRSLFWDWERRTLDNHSPVWRLSYYVELCLAPFLNHVMSKEYIDCICYPDPGAKLRYGNMLSQIGLGGLPLLTADKQRDPNTGKIIKIQLDDGNCKNKTVFMIDDICSYGGTSNGTAQQLKQRGAKQVIAWFSHTELSILQGRIFEDGYINRIYTTNSIANSYHNNVTVLTLDGENNIKELTQ